MSRYPRTYADIAAQDDLTVGDDITLGGDVVLDRSSANNLRLATGDTFTADDIVVVDDLTVGDDLTVTGLATIGETLGVTGVATFINASTVFSSNSAALTVGTTNPAVVNFSANKLTLAAGDTLAVTDADKFTVGGIIVPQFFYINHEVHLHAARTEWDIFPCVDAFEVVAIRYAPSILQGGALTGTLVKAAGTTIPVKTTTPLHAEDAIDFDGDLWTVQTIALTATGADLIFAAGNRIGIDLSGALTVGQGVISIKCKRV